MKEKKLREGDILDCEDLNEGICHLNLKCQLNLKAILSHYMTNVSQAHRCCGKQMHKYMFSKLMAALLKNTSG